MEIKPFLFHGMHLLMLTFAHHSIQAGQAGQAGRAGRQAGRQAVFTHMAAAGPCLHSMPQRWPLVGKGPTAVSAPAC